jgi:hypothetical protein
MRFANSGHRDDLKNIFAPLITNILELIEKQVDKVKIKRPDKDITVRPSRQI